MSSKQTEKNEFDKFVEILKIRNKAYKKKPIEQLIKVDKEFNNAYHQLHKNIKNWPLIDIIEAM